jgi:hypothetical protein
VRNDLTASRRARLDFSAMKPPALHFRTARDILDKVRRERSRYADGPDGEDQTAAADHQFFSHRDDADEAIAEWEKFLTTWEKFMRDRGL